MHISESSAGSYESAVSVSYINQPVLKMPVWSEGVILVLCNLTEINHETRTLDRIAQANCRRLLSSSKRNSDLKKIR